MKRKMIASILIASMFAAVSLLLIPTAAQALSLHFVPPDQIVFRGDPVSAELWISGVESLTTPFLPSIGSFDINIAFDHSILTFTGHELGPHLGDPLLGEAFDDSLGETTPGIINLAELSLLEPDPDNGFFGIPPFLEDLQPDSFWLATLMFDAVGLGTTLLDPLENQPLFFIGDGFGQSLTDTAQVSFTALSGSITVVERATPIPEPSTILLLLGGAGLMTAFKMGFNRKNPDVQV